MPDPKNEGKESKPSRANSSEEQRRLIGSRLRAARDQAGLSQGQVARLLGKHRPSISEAEAGNRGVPAEELADLARLYGVSSAWLTGEDRQDVVSDVRVELAARELAKFKPEDLDRLLHLLTTLRTNDEQE